MPQINSSTATFLDQFINGLAELLSRPGQEKVAVSWSPRPFGALPADLVWCSCGVSVDTACRFFAGAPAETWELLRGVPDSESGDLENDFAVVAEAMQRAAQVRFGSQVACIDMGPADEPSQDWTGADLNITEGTRSYPAMAFVMSPALLTALGGSQMASQPPLKVENHIANSAGMLMNVEIPVSVSLGRTEMRLKDVLALTSGSIVELDQYLSDDVEIRVNNCVIARGEVVAVDGNYGVRILKMVSEGSGQRAQRAAAE